MFKENLDQFLEPADFGLEVIRDGFSYHGIFDNTTVAVDVDGEVQVDSQQPLVLVKEVDFPDISQGEILTLIDPNLELNTDYVVTAMAPDGTGMLSLALNKT